MNAPQGVGAWSAYSRELGTNLRQVREAKGLAEGQVATPVGMRIATYRRYEEGEQRSGEPTNPTLRTVMSLAAAFDVDVAELLPTRDASVR